jgi:hypothetical protein
MAGKTATVVFGAGLVLAAVFGSVVPGAVAGASSASGAVRPGQTFVGLVDGTSTVPSVVVVCPEAIQVGEKGHPAAGQTIEVRAVAATTAASGATGTRGQAIVARFGTTGAVSGPSVTFTRYGSQPLPTTLLLPCLGSGTVEFSARPTRSTARSETLGVAYVTPCPGICADHRP